jgi:hypothetical protein
MYSENQECAENNPRTRWEDMSLGEPQQRTLQFSNAGRAG